MVAIKNSLSQSHDLVQSVVKEGDTVIDATAGNGNDTAFLAKLVGDKGRVYAFDIQEQAVNKTRKRLENLGLENRVQLIQQGHEHLDQYVKEEIKAVMFNLGYLPGGEHHIGTKAETTIEAIAKAMEILPINGIVSIVVYYGGDSGFEEKEKVLRFVRQIDCKKFTVMQTEFVNQVNCPPILVCIEKISDKIL